MTTFAYMLLCIGLGIYLFGFLLGKPDQARTHRSPTWTRMLSSGALVLTALIWWLGVGRTTSLAAYTAFLFGGMLCSFVGDLILARVLPLPNHVIFGMLVFGLAHVLYILGYVQAGRFFELGSAGAWIGGVIGLVALGVIAWWVLVRSPDADPILGYGSLAYGLLLAGMTGVAISLALQDARFLMLATGALLFFISDIILGNRLLRENDWFLVGDVVWIFYIGGQALIIFSPAALL